MEKPVNQRLFEALCRDFDAIALACGGFLCNAKGLTGESEQDEPDTAPQGAIFEEWD
jgi:hypothetical protein